MGRATGCSGCYENHFDFQSVDLSFSCPRKESPRRSDAIPKAQINQMTVQKMQAVVPKMQVKPSFNSERYVLNKRPISDRMLAELCIQTQGKAAMERCALCHGKLGLGTRFGNIWNGRWWIHVRFCSVRCESIYEAKRHDAAKQRWHAFLARGNLRS
jgi:hypothetical protein